MKSGRSCGKCYLSALNAYNDVHITFGIQSNILVDFADFMIKEIEDLYNGQSLKCDTLDKWREYIRDI
ncbi:hypothetical protein G9F72_014230 [Clostridium estertheticum]|uniref:hypothetical protein n=1 Tax=Clostridium estertheticum TaxID=238834 RepID=UPI001CD146FA|nr:hypothetical protein [Clostridium estertheticum]MBZ9687485.1 hypothetical protein [Clostridium estertheticum]